MIPRSLAAGFIHFELSRGTLRRKTGIDGLSPQDLRDTFAERRWLELSSYSAGVSGPRRDCQRWATIGGLSAGDIRLIIAGLSKVRGDVTQDCQ
jgi:hypothetical protein